MGALFSASANLIGIEVTGCRTLCRCDQCNCCTQQSGCNRRDLMCCWKCIRVPDLENKIKLNLKTAFNLIRLPVILCSIDVPFEKFTKLELQRENRDQKGINVELKNIFDDIDNFRSARILIEAQPGFGKTSLAHKIVSDWEKNEEYVGKFKFAILVILRHLKKGSLQEELADRVAVENYDKEESWSVINNKNTLLVLDGLDEVGERARENIFKILQNNKNNYRMTIILTSRIGSTRLNEEESITLHRGISLSQKFWSKKITILGITEENRDEFLRNFVQDDSNNTKMTRIREIVKDREEMFKSPLLKLLADVMNDYYKDKIKTYTDLYKRFVDCIIRRSVNKEHPGTLNQNFTLFDETYNGECKTLFCKFGEMALDHILHDQLQFEADEQTEAIYQIGFLSKHEMETSLDLTVHYEGFHLSILEFAAAYFMIEKFKANENIFPPEIITNINQICTDKGSTSLVIPFLCGLLQKNVYALFEQFSPYKIVYWLDQKLIEQLLNECEVNDTFAKFFKEFAPPSFTIVNAHSISAMNNNHLKNCFENVIIFWECLPSLTQPIEFNTICVPVISGRDPYPENMDQIAKNIKCNSFTLILAGSVSLETFILSIKLFDQVSASRKNLQIFIEVNAADSSYTCVKKCFENDVLKGWCGSDFIDNTN